MPTRISEPKIFRTSYSADTNVLEQENVRALSLKIGLQAKERRAGGTVALFGLLTPLRWLPPPW